MTRKYLCCQLLAGKILSAKEKCMRPKCKSIVAKTICNSTHCPISFVPPQDPKRISERKYLFESIIAIPAVATPPLRHQSIKNTHTTFCGRIPLFNVGVVLGQGFFVVVLSPSRWGNSENVRWLS